LPDDGGLELREPRLRLVAGARGPISAISANVPARGRPHLRRGDAQQPAPGAGPALVHGPHWRGGGAGRGLRVCAGCVAEPGLSAEPTDGGDAAVGVTGEDAKCFSSLRPPTRPVSPKWVRLKFHLPRLSGGLAAQAGGTATR